MYFSVDAYPTLEACGAMSILMKLIRIVVIDAYPTLHVCGDEHIDETHTSCSVDAYPTLRVCCYANIDETHMSSSDRCLSNTTHMLRWRKATILHASPKFRASEL